MTCVIAARNLQKAYNRSIALDDVSFELNSGEITALLGKNGAGKSTTLSLLTGRLEPDHGEIEVMGRKVSDNPVSARSQIGFLPEGAPLFDDLTVLAQLQTMAGLKGLSGLSSKAAIDDVIARFELSDRRHARVDTLSKGFRRRVALAAACLGDPPILILDEPTDGLDPFQKDRVLQQLRDAKQDQALLISTHSLEDVSEICDRVIILDDGRLIFDDRVDALAATAPGKTLEAAFKALIAHKDIAV